MKTSDVLFLLSGLAGLTAFVLLYESAFPAAAIDLDLSRSQVREAADAYVSQHGIDPDTFESTLTFEVDQAAGIFLQKVRGLEETQRFARERLALWHWRARWFRPGEKEEFLLRLAPDGRPLRFSHIIAEAAPGDSLSEDSARVVATAFVMRELDVDLSNWRLEDQATEALDNRIDHSFTWERIGSEIEWRPGDPEAGAAAIRLEVGLHGAGIGSFRRYLDVPERFLRELRKELSIGSLLAAVALGLGFAFVIAALILGFVMHKRDEVRWGPGLAVGAVAGVAVAMTGLLSFPLMKAAYPTETPYSVYVIGIIGAALVAGTLFGLGIWVTSATGEALTERRFADALTGFRDWAARRFFTRAAAVETLRGYAVGLAFLGYVAVFYVIGTRYLGVWLPADSPHSQLLSMYLPWLVPLLIAVQATISEEIVYRLFGISFLKRYVKITFLALLIPGMIWAFGHSTYPVFPVYVRGIELTIAGLIFGWIFIRYGLLTMLVAHYAIDAILVAMPFLRAAGGSYLGYGIAALVCAALPLIVPTAVFVAGKSSGRVAADLGS